MGLTLKKSIASCTCACAHTQPLNSAWSALFCTSRGTGDQKRSNLFALVQAGGSRLWRFN